MSADEPRPTPLEFVAAVHKVSTLADGGVRVVLDLPEGALLEMAGLAAYQTYGVALQVAVKPDGRPDSESGDETSLHI